MNNTENKTSNTESKRHVRILIGISLIILAAVFAYFAASQPNISGNTVNSDNGTPSQQTEASNTLATENDATQGTPQTGSQPTESQASSAPTEAPTNAPDVTETTESKTTAPTVSVQYPLNLNTCTAAELMTIDGIGEARASAIIAYREYLGGYTDVEQLKNISGIGDGIFAKIEPYVTV